MCLKHSAKVLLSKGDSRYQAEMNTIPHKSLSTFMASLYSLLYNFYMNFTCLYFAKKYTIVSFLPLPLFSTSRFFFKESENPSSLSAEIFQHDAENGMNCSKLTFISQPGDCLSSLRIFMVLFRTSIYS